MEKKIDYESIGLKVGLEIHQQLDTGSKLFCSCKPVEIEELDSEEGMADHANEDASYGKLYPVTFSRKLRLAKSELGQYDPAAVFETSKSKTIVYHASLLNSCLVEQDEEPPHHVDPGAKRAAILISSCLNAVPFSEIHVMRKMVIDGSNTSGFQRTMLVSLGGYLEVGSVQSSDGGDNNVGSGKKERVGVQSVCLEEDAAKMLKDDVSTRQYSLDRLGIPLVEIALEPVAGSPAFVKDVALTLGRLLRSTKMVKRGIGSIRQDINVSIQGGGIVEIKGVQQLDQLQKVIEYEAKRQHGMKLVAQRIQEAVKARQNKSASDDASKESVVLILPEDKDGFVKDVSSVFSDTQSKVILSTLKKPKGVIKAIKAPLMRGVFGWEPYEGIRLGRQIGELVKFYGFGGIFHSDELPNYGISQEEVDKTRELVGCGESDAFLLISGEDSVKMTFAIDAIIQRINQAANGIPGETRGARLTGETVYLRPRPGASRMYPETDVPPVLVPQEELEDAKKNIPRSWDESLEELQKSYDLNRQLAEQIFDSNYLDVFENICKRHSQSGRISANYVASFLCGTLTMLERKGLDSEKLKEHHITRAFELLAQGKIAKESLETIFEALMSEKNKDAKTVDQIVSKIGVQSVDHDELERKLSEIVDSNTELIQKQGQHATGALMGVAMKEFRGKADGKTINEILAKKIKEKLGNS